MKNQAIIVFILHLISTGLFGMDYYSLFNKHVHLKENYVLVEDVGIKKTVIPFHFNKSITHFDAKLFKSMDPRKIRGIEYIYYDNPSKSHQEKLNNARIDSLVKLFGSRLKNVHPSVFSTIILSNSHNCKTQFTGFVITTELSDKEYKLLLTQILTGEIDSKNKSTFTLDTLQPYGYILPHLHPNHHSKELNVISATMKRNKSWKNKLVVVDVTGSMAPYLGQYLLWLKLHFNPKDVQNYVFFNDGNDNKGFTKKEIGKTGGLYFTQNIYGYETIEKTIFTAMRNGNGGDLPENNIESLIAGEKNFKMSGDIILIADNYASPRDMSLINNLKKPVHVILCGVKNGYVNKDYLTLAYRTKGSVHTIEDDLTHLVKKKEGDTFTFLGCQFKIKDGEIVEIKKQGLDG